MRGTYIIRCLYPLQQIMHRVNIQYSVQDEIKTRYVVIITSSNSLVKSLIPIHPKTYVIFE